MSNHGEALLRAICENPADDTIRLVFADWLEENGQPHRGEFIRLQIELAAMPRNSWYGTPQQKRTDELLLEFDPSERAIEMKVAKRPKRSWSADLPTGEGVEWHSWYTRGFRSTVTFASMKSVRSHAKAVVESSPVENVTVKRMTAFTVAELLAQPWVANLTTLQLSGSVGAIGAETLAASEVLRRLQRLELESSQMTDSGLKALAASTALPNLIRLGLKGNTRGVTERGLNDLMRSATLKKLTAVDGVRFTLLPISKSNPLRIFIPFYKRFPDST